MKTIITLLVILVSQAAQAQFEPIAAAEISEPIKIFGKPMYAMYCESYERAFNQISRAGLTVSARCVPQSSKFRLHVQVNLLDARACGRTLVARLEEPYPNDEPVIHGKFGTDPSGAWRVFIEELNGRPEITVSGSACQPARISPFVKSIPMVNPHNLIVCDEREFNSMTYGQSSVYLDRTPFVETTSRVLCDEDKLQIQLTDARPLASCDRPTYFIFSFAHLSHRECNFIAKAVADQYQENIDKNLLLEAECNAYAAFRGLPSETRLTLKYQQLDTGKNEFCK